MPNTTCLIALTATTCTITQEHATIGALATSIVSLLGLLIKLWFDRSERVRRQEFEAKERKEREDFETRLERERLEFQREQADEDAKRQKALQEYVRLGEWREDSWERARQRLEEATKLLYSTVGGLNALIDQGPTYNDLQMIRETAPVLDLFGRFKSEAQHFSLPVGIVDRGDKLLQHMTKVLLTLSPSREVRQSPDRQAILTDLKSELDQLTAEYLEECRRFLHSPDRFD